MAAPFVAYATYEWLQKREIDEHKLIPLFVAVGSVGILLVGVLNWGTAGGGYFGVTEGDYAFQHAEVNLLWQALGLAVCLGAGLATGAVLVAVLKRTTGLVVDEDVQVAGFDAAYWEIDHDLDPGSGAGRGGRSRRPRRPARSRTAGTATARRRGHRRPSDPGKQTKIPQRSGRRPDPVGLCAWTTSVATDTKLAA